MQKGGLPMSADKLTLTDKTFDEHIQGADIPVLVDFWAEWCGPCKQISPILDEIAEENPGRIQIARLNVDDNLETTRRFEVMSIPTLILFKEGEPSLRIVGARPKSRLVKELEPYLSERPSQ
jgi:thioredoxin 1